MTDQPTQPKTETPLESWKAIATYLNRDARTVMRWEQSEGLPVHRHRHLARSSVYAFPSELDAWRANRRPEGKAAEGRQANRGPQLLSLAAMFLLAVVTAGGGRFAGPILAADQDGQRPPASLRSAKVEVGRAWNYAAGAVSADGRYLPFADMDHNLALHDLTDGSQRVIATYLGESAGFPTTAAVSRDSAQIAFNWCHGPGPEKDEVCELRVQSLRGARTEPRVLAANADVTLAPLDWSPDGTQILVRMSQDNAMRVGFVNLQTGAIRPLKTVDWRNIRRASFSPDGLDVAFDVQTSGPSPSRDVLVIATDGSREAHVVNHPAVDLLVGWAPDGGRLLFASNRRGQTDLYAVSWASRRAQGDPQLLAADVKEEPLGVSRSGAIYMQGWVNDSVVEIAEVDFAAGRVVGSPTRLHPTGTSGNPAWSPDGREIAYVGPTPPGAGATITIRRLDTGATRDVRTIGLARRPGLTWTPDGRSFIVHGAQDGKYGLYRIDAQTGAVAPFVVPIASNDEVSYEGVFWSPDGSRLYYHSQNGKIHERNTASGETREVARGAYGPISLSPDGQWIATGRSAEGSTPAAVVALSVSTGQVRELMRLEPGQALNNVAMPWSRDSRIVVARKMLGGGKSELWLAAIDGSAPRKLDFDANRIREAAPGIMRLHPDGRRLAYVAGKTTPEVWVLEGAIPVASPKR